jgi:hypothetical protein
MFNPVAQKNKFEYLRMGEGFRLRVNQLSYSFLVHWITTDQLLFEGSLSNEWAAAALTETNFLVLLLDPTF